MGVYHTRAGGHTVKDVAVGILAVKVVALENTVAADTGGLVPAEPFWSRYLCLQLPDAQAAQTLSGVP